MDEHRRRAQRRNEAPEVLEAAAQQPQKEAAHSEQAHTVHRRRLQAMQPMPRIENAEQAQPKKAEKMPNVEADDQPSGRERPADAAKAASPKRARSTTDTTHEAKTHQVRTHKKPAKHAKNNGELKKMAEQWALTAALLLNAVFEAIAALVKKAYTLLRKLTASLKGKRLPVRGIAMVLLAGVALYSAYQIGAILLRSLRTNQLNDDLARQRAALMEQSDLADAALEAQAGSLPDPEAISTPVPVSDSQMVRMEQNDEQMEIESAPAATRAPDRVKSVKYHQVGGEALPEMAALREKNRDLVAWIQIPDVLDLPVVYRDNDYYLTHDFNKQKNASGTLFLDVNHPFREKTQNLLLHGHNMKDGTMFGRLAQYLYDDTYLRNHPFVYFDTLWKKEQYVIVAVLNVSLDPKNERFFNYFTHDTFASDAEFSAYIRQLQIRSAYAIPIDVEPSDALLTLSTCLDDDRLVIVCRRLRANETRSQLRELIRISGRQ